MWGPFRGFGGDHAKPKNCPPYSEVQGSPTNGVLWQELYRSYHLFCVRVLLICTVCRAKSYGLAIFFFFCSDTRAVWPSWPLVFVGCLA